MLKSWLVLLVVVLPSVMSNPAKAQEDVTLEEDYSIQSDSLKATPELWMYLREQKRHDDPKMAVRRNAEQRAAERRRRLASRKWFGLSNQRPMANPTPFFGNFSPMWVGDFWDPYRWAGYSFPTVMFFGNGILGVAR